MSDTFEFELAFALPDEVDIDEQSLLDTIFEAGFEDAVVGLGARGMVGIALEEEGEDAETVISGCVLKLMQALPKGSRLREVRPDLVSLAEVAARLNIKRQALQKRRKMPAPSVGGLYRASEIYRALVTVSKDRGTEIQRRAGSWLAASRGAQRINARLALEALDEIEEQKSA